MQERNCPLEADEQIAFINYCNMKNIRVISTQNGFKMPKNGFNYIGYSKKLKKMGLSKGFPDLIIFAKISKHQILFIEMKRQKGGNLREEQKGWINWLKDNNYQAFVAKGYYEAVIILEEYLKN